jgi:LysR family transcriptional regulator for bpeEF and oprC
MQYLAQCREILALIEHSESSLSESVARPQGRLRVDMPAGIAHFIVMPHLQDFYRRYPDIYLMIGVSDRPVDLIQEGVDCVIRTGELNNSSLVARLWAAFAGSPARHRTIFGNMACRRHRRRSLSTGRCITSPARRGGPMSSACSPRRDFSVPISGTAAVNETGLYIKMCLAGFGLAQLAENIVADHLREGAGGSADGLAAAAGTRHIALSAPALSLSRRAGVC